MKTSTMKQALLAVSFGIALFSCSKEKSSTNGCSISMTHLSGTYTLKALQYQASANAAPADYLATLEDCEKDDIITLKSDGSYQYDDLGITCSPSGNEHGNWEVKGNALASDGMLNGVIDSYDCKTLVYHYDNALMPGDKLTFTLQKK